MSPNISIYDEMKALEKTFGLSCCKLLEKHPLYNYRACDSGRYTLSVLLIGSGIRLEMLRDKILSNGQLLDTHLEVTILTEEPAAEAARLESQAPELHRFIHIRVHSGEEILEKKAQWDCGILIYKPLPKAKQKRSAFLKNYPLPLYTLVSTEDPGLNQAIKNDLRSSAGQLIVCADGDNLATNNPKDKPFTPKPDDAYLNEIRHIAYQLHYAYAKGNNPMSADEEILADFLEPYNLESNIECALHIRSKIKCANIDPSSLNTASEEFSKKMEQDAQEGGHLLEELSRLEHRRWCLTKFLKGFVLGTPEQIYQKSGDTTHSAGGKWHIALVPYGEQGSLCRRLNDQDWIDPDPESLADLDELDRQTLRVHKRCGELLPIHLAEAIDLVTGLEAGLRGELQVHTKNMRDVMALMLRGDRSTVPLYRHHLQKLNGALNEQEKQALRASLKELAQLMSAPLEYLSQKDYKEQNFLLVSRIPFALSYWKKTVLVKLMADRVEDCISSLWQLEPTQVLFLDTAEKMEDLRQLRRKARQINYFLQRNCSQITASYHIFVPNHVDAGKSVMAEILEDYPAFFDSCNWHVYPRNSLDVTDLRPRFVELMHEHGVTAIDLTGGKPELITIADSFARNSRTGAFFVRDNTLHNFYGACGISHQALDKGLSVQALFDLAGAARIKQDARVISRALNAQYRDLWSVSQANADIWHWFCTCFAAAYRDQPGQKQATDPLYIDKQTLREAISSGRDPAGFQAILEQLLEKKLLKPARGNGYRASCEDVLDALRNTGKALEYYIYCTASASGLFEDVVMSWMFQHREALDAAKNEIDVICTGKHTTLFISAKNVTMKRFKTDKNFLNYVCYEVGWLADRFAGADHRMVLAAPNVPMLDEHGNLSHYAAHALSRGVHLLGDECFRDDNLSRVLKEIRDGNKLWYACLEKAVK